MWKQFIEKIVLKAGIRRSAGFPWSKGIPDRNFPRPMTGGSGCLAPVIIVSVISLGLLGILVPG